MKKNIISVEAVELKGLKVTLKNGILKITKGSMVVMKCIRDRNLYYLKGSIVQVLWQVQLTRMMMLPSCGT